MRLSVGCHGEEHRQNGNGGPAGLHELEPPALEARPGTSPGRVSSDVNGKVVQPPLSGCCPLPAWHKLDLLGCPSTPTQGTRGMTLAPERPVAPPAMMAA